MPALSGTVWPDVDFEWYANVGRTAAPSQAATTATATRTDYGVIPGHEEPRGADLAAPAVTSSPEFPDRALATSQPGGRSARTVPDTELVSPTLPYSGSNRR